MKPFLGFHAKGDYFHRLADLSDTPNTQQQEIKNVIRITVKEIS